MLNLFMLIVDMGYNERTQQRMYVPFTDDGSGPCMKLYTMEQIETMKETHQLQDFDWIAINVTTLEAELI